MVYTHLPVLLTEALANLQLQRGKIYVDGTLGGAGHAREIARRILPGGVLIAIDRDPAAIAQGQTLHAEFKSGIHLFQGSFARLPHFLDQLHLSAVDGILLDLGISRHQLLESGRGFSFNLDEPLDMRMDPDLEPSAAQLVNRLSFHELRGILRAYGEEHQAGKVAKAIVAARESAPITTSGQLTAVVVEALGARPARGKRIHPATKTFMALRIAVNRELETLSEVMGQVDSWLNPGGRLCVIAFHSLEDRIVKHGIRNLAQGCRCPKDLPQCGCGLKPRLRVVAKKAIRPSAAEISANPLARSSRLRVAEKI
ncbi:MAG: 16S rRNA (cytosine(1402)-N(4))-methyltransferase RsmH [Desulfobacterales bacterium]|jgi:16S rRNA (cytosine1402-N4)-methyltransferase